LKARPGDGGIRTRKIAILVAPGIDGASIATLQQALLDAGAIPRLVGVRIGAFETADGSTLEADASMENSPGVLFDALILPAGEAGVKALAAVGNTTEFVMTQYRHCKTILALGESSMLLDKAGISATLPSGDADPGLLTSSSDDAANAAQAFIAAVALHRHDAREMDPPMV
jgi:catalase